MSWLFTVDPRIIISAVSIFGGLYFFCVCLEDAKTLLAYQRMQTKTEHKSWRQFFLQASQNARWVYQQMIIALHEPALPDDRLLPLYPLPPQGD